MSALEVVVDRIDTLERHTRLHAQSIAQQHEAVGVVSPRMSATTHDIDAYKTSVSSCHANMDLVLTDRMGKLQAQIDSVTAVVGPTVELLESCMRELEFALGASSITESGAAAARDARTGNTSNGNTALVATGCTETSRARSLGPVCRRTPLQHIAQTSCARGPTTATTH